MTSRKVVWLYPVDLLFSVSVSLIMTTVISKVACVKCKRSKNTVNCSGCARDFCLAHINDHYKELSEQQSRAEDQFKQIKNNLEAQYIQIPRQKLIKEIDNWEKESIETIRQVAARVRGQVSSRIEAATADLNSTLIRLTDRLCQYRREDDFGDKDVQSFGNELKQLKASRYTLPDCKLGYRSKPFIDKIHLVNEGRTAFSFVIGRTEIISLRHTHAHPHTP